MKTKMTAGGRVVIPAQIRKFFDIQPGDAADVGIDGYGRIVLIFERKRKRKYKGRIIKDPILGTPVLTFGPDAPKLTTELVNAMLVDFP